jgi:uncharacterized membrane protein
MGDEHNEDADPEGADPEAAEHRPDVGPVRHLLHQLERALVRSEQQVMGDVGSRVLPAWRRATDGESRWQGSLGVIAALMLQVTLPDHVAVSPRWLLPTIAGLLLVAIVVANPRRINRTSRGLRVGSMVLIAIISGSNAGSAGQLITDLVRGEATGDAARLLLTGGAIWLTNVLTFSLWYWELDRGGPAARAHAIREYTDFLFAQMQNPELAPDDWEPAFIDYLYLSFTNAAAFSPTDVLPLSRWAKMTMLVQSAISLSTVALVVARAVNTLR